MSQQFDHSEAAPGAPDARLLSILCTQQEIATAELDFDALLQLVCRRALELTGADGAAVELEEAGELVFKAGAGIAQSEVGSKLTRRSLSYRCLVTSETQTCSDTEADDRVDLRAARVVGIRSTVIVPLQHQHRTIGALRLIWTQPNGFGREHVDTLEHLSKIIASSMNRSRIQQQRHVLSASALSLSAAENMRSVAEVIRDSAALLWKWDAFLLSVRRSGHDRFRTLINVDTVAGERREFPQFEYEARIYRRFAAVLQGQSVLVNRAEVSRDIPAGAFGDRSNRSMSLMYAPLREKGEVMGILSVQSYTPNFFQEEDRLVLEKLAHIASPAVSRCRIQQYNQLFSELAHSLNSAAGPVEVAEVIARAADELLGWDSCSVETLSPDGQMLRTVLVYDNLNGKKITRSGRQNAYSPLTPLARKTLRQGGQLILRQPDLETGDSTVSPVRTTPLPVTLALVPLRTGTQHVGVMSVQSFTPNAYTEKDLATLQSLGDYCAGALHRTQTEQTLRESEEKHRLLVEHVSDGIVLSQDQAFIYFNECFAQMLGYEPGELGSRSFKDIHTSKGLEVLYQRAARRQRGELLSSRYETTYRRKDGNEITVEVNAAIIENFRGAPATFAVVRDITSRKLAENALRESEERYALAVEGANDGLWDWDLRTDSIYLSPRWKAMLGFPDDELETTLDSWFGRVHAEDLDRLKSEIQSHLNSGTPHFENEHRIAHRDGSYRWVLTRGMCLRNRKGEAYRIAGSLTDITMRKAAEEELLHGAYHDALTGLPNRSFFMECLTRALAQAGRRTDFMFSVLFLDLDRFKLINDSLGHMIGDQFLVAIARRLEHCIRPGDIVARLGGDEFTVLLDDVKDMNDATRVADRIQRELALPLNINGHEMYTSASIGIAFSGRTYGAPEELLRDADIAMYRAKATGKARYQLFDRGMHEKAVAQLQLETDLRRAIERNEFTMVYQPLVSLQTKDVCGFEALIRWDHPERGFLLPQDFISVAEETGLIVPIGSWVFSEVARQVSAWQTRFPTELPVPVSINLSARQFSHPGLVEEIQNVLHSNKLEPYSLTLEMTESAVMDNAEAFAGTLVRMKAMQLQLHIDDFGTGYSSLSYLQKFPVDILKIDRSFVSSLQTDSDNIEIVRAVVNLAHSLRMGVVAEGVETPEQADILHQIGCEYAQGFFFHEPLSADAAERIVEQLWMARETGASKIS